MLVFSGKVHHLRHFGFRHLVRINAAFADSVMMDVEHDASRALAVLVEETLQHVHHEFHRRVVVVEKQQAIEDRLLGRAPVTNRVAERFQDRSRLQFMSGINRREIE
jgi:hypothetical protein